MRSEVSPVVLAALLKARSVLTVQKISTPDQIYGLESCENSQNRRQSNQKYTIITTAREVNLVHDLSFKGTRAKSVVCYVGRFFRRCLSLVCGERSAALSQRCFMHLSENEVLLLFY
jgi:hypothetical protein